MSVPAERGLGPLWRPVAIFAAGRAVMYAAVFAALRLSVHGLTTGPGHRPMSGTTFVGTLGGWDGGFWVRAATSGYPHHLPMVGGHPGQSTVAFFPGYPLLIRGLYHITGLAPVDAALIISGGASLLASVLLWAFVHQHWGRTTADRATALFCFFPGSIVFSMAYSEGLLLVAVIVCMWALWHHRWVTAGLAGLVASATHPNALGLIVLCLIAAIVAARRGEWRAFVAPVLASIGVSAFVVFLRLRTGSWMAWPDTERGGWHDHADFLGIPRHLAGAIHGHYGLPVIIALGSVSVAVGLYWACRSRLPWLLSVWIGLAALPAVASDAASLRPRMALVAFPIFIAAALSLSKRAYVITLGASAVALFCLAAYQLTSLSISP